MQKIPGDIELDKQHVAHLKLIASWQDCAGQHTAIEHIENFNVWRDIDLLPGTIVENILGQKVGGSYYEIFPVGEIISDWQQEYIKTVSLLSFNSKRINGCQVKPEIGRYYPKSWFSGVEQIPENNHLAVRILDIQNDSMIVDFNHPLAGKPVKLGVEIMDIKLKQSERGGRCDDALEKLLNNGPGMQTPVKSSANSFYTPDALSRIDESDDSVFYESPRKVHHLDQHARQIIKEFYAQYLSPGGNVLDLMASWESHIDNTRLGLHICGLGMNEEELKSNPCLDLFVIKDLNKSTSIPCRDSQFSGVVCTASVEYLTQPLKVFEEIRRVLKPQGVCAIAFSNRWFPGKAIKQWTEMHDFERIGLVIDYFKKSGWTGKINSFSCRGLSRPLDDPHIEKTNLSDPVYIVWAYK